MTHGLFPSDIDQLKQVLAARAPGVASSHRAEAMARGLRFSSNAALRVALGNGPVEITADDAAFNSFLEGRGNAPLQSITFSDALAEAKYPQERAAIRAVLTYEPSLCPNGMRTRHNTSGFEDSRAGMLSLRSVKEFIRVTEWLDTVETTPRISSRRTSYGYKHDVERWSRDNYSDQLSYIPNGMFIAAALHRGFKIRRDDPGSPNVLLNLKVRGDEPPRRERSNLAGDLRGPKKLHAWRNVMVAGINAGLTQRVFGIQPDENWWSGDSAVYRFEFDGLPAIASASDIGHGELSVRVAVEPTAKADRFIGSFNSGFYAGEAFCSGYLERKLGAWLQSPKAPTGSIRVRLLEQLCAADVTPQGFADRGKVIL